MAYRPSWRRSTERSRSSTTSPTGTRAEALGLIAGHDEGERLSLAARPHHSLFRPRCIAMSGADRQRAMLVADAAGITGYIRIIPGQTAWRRACPDVAGRRRVGRARRIAASRTETGACRRALRSRSGRCRWRCSTSCRAPTECPPNLSSGCSQSRRLAWPRSRLLLPLPPAPAALAAVSASELMKVAATIAEKVIRISMRCSIVIDGINGWHSPPFRFLTAKQIHDLESAGNVLRAAMSVRAWLATNPSCIDDRFERAKPDGSRT